MTIRLTSHATILSPASAEPEDVDLPALPRADGSHAPAGHPIGEVFQRIQQALDRNLFFIIGCEKSGTTWVQRILDGHPQVCCKGEARLTQSLLPLLQRAIREYNGSQTIGEAGCFDDSDFAALFVTAAGMMFDRWVQASEHPQRIRAIGEKSPEHTKHIQLFHSLFPEARFVHIIRDPRDVVTSGWFHNQRTQPAGFAERFPTLAAYARYMIESHWVPYVSQARTFGRSQPLHYFELKYEDLHRQPRSVIRQLLRFLSVDPGAEMVQRVQQAGAFETLTGGRARGEEDLGSFFRKGIVGDWKQHLDDTTAHVILSLAGDAMRELGYIE